MASRAYGTAAEAWREQQAERKRMNREWHERKKARDGEMKQLSLMAYPVPPLGPVSRSVYLPPAGSIARSFFGIERRG